MGDLDARWMRQVAAQLSRLSSCSALLQRTHRPAAHAQSALRMASSVTTAGSGRWALSNVVADEISRGLDVWTVFSPASGFVPKDSLNLGQGFMSWAPPAFVQDAIHKSINGVMEHHYSHPRGRIGLRNALSKYLSSGFNLPEGRELDPESEVLVTAGGNGGMYAFATAFLQPGDEVIIFEPFFDQYPAQITFNGGVPRYVALKPPAKASTSTVSAAEWTIDMDELEATITPRTKSIWVNTAHNPTGKVFSEDELLAIGRLARKHNLLILSDEVYDCLAFAPARHTRIAALEDFWERTVTVGSVGKSFACTGWRVGWSVGPKDLIRGVLAAHTRLVFSCNSPAQEAAGDSIVQALDNGFFDKQRDEYIERRQVLMEGLDKLGLPYTVPDGAYYILVNIERLQIPDDFETLDIIKHKPNDWRAAWFIAKTAGVVTIPPTDFYSAGHTDIGEKFIRIAFCKDPDTLRAACERLLQLEPYI